MRKNKNTKKVKESKTITYQPKTFENLNIADIKSVTTKHPKTSKTTRPTEKVGSNRSLYSDTKKVKILQMRKL